MMELEYAQRILLDVLVFAGGLVYSYDRSIEI
jgi:hypothetical protein